MKLHTFFLIVILLVSIFFRTYDILGRFGYGHDAELFSWIVKDIIVNQHPRLIGQLTSAPGIFIGPLFYYLLAPFFLLAKMDPAGALIPVTLIGILTTLSYFFVFSRLFNKNSGLIAAFLHAILLPLVKFDRWVVPSTLTNIWIIWYFYTTVQIARGNFFVLPLLGILIGLIWHIHIALLPALFAVPFAFLVSKKIPKLKEIKLAAGGFLITSLPLIIFEVKHNFIQTRSLIENFSDGHGGEVGLPKLIQILEMITKNINSLFFSPYSLPQNLKYLFVLSFIIPAIILIKKGLLTKKEVLTLSAIFSGFITFFTFSSSLVSEYYLYSLEIIFVAILALTLTLIMRRKIGFYVTIIILGSLFAKNLYHFLTEYTYKKDYQERKAAVEFITWDAKIRKFPCIGITYITDPGENTGFRYFFYLKNQHLALPSNNVPVYNIVIPDELVQGEIMQKFGHIGVIPPTKILPRDLIEKTCQSPNTNLTDPMFGYVE